MKKSLQPSWIEQGSSWVEQVSLSQVSL